MDPSEANCVEPSTTTTTVTPTTTTVTPSTTTVTPTTTTVTPTTTTVTPSTTTVTPTTTTVTPTTTTTIPEVCPPPGSTEKVFLPHECVCTQYYECINGKKVLRYCPKDKHFNPRQQNCTDPSEAGCESTGTPTESTTTTKSTITTTKSTTTKSTTTKSTTTKSTTTKSTTTKSSTITTTESTTTTKNPNPREECPKGSNETARILHPYQCNLYYECVNGEKSLRECPIGKHFDYVREVCDWPSVVNCIRPVPTSKPATDSENVENNNLIQSFNGENNNEREIFNNLDPSTCIGTCPEEDPEYAVLLPNDECTNFCLCSNGIAYVMSCFVPLYFDSVDKVCKQKKDAVCAVRPFSQDRTFVINGKIDNDNLIQLLNDKNNNEREIFDNLDPSTCIGTCPEEDPEYAVLLPNDECTNFCLCSNGIAYVMSCPVPLYFDSVDKVCKQKKDAVCAVRPFNQDRTFVIDENVENNNLIQSSNDENNNKREISDNLDPSTCIGTCPEEDPIYAVLLPNEDCKKFCLCSNGIAYVMSCPVPLYFDSVDKVCKQKKNAVCAVRPFSQSLTFMINGKVDEDYMMQFINGENNDEYKT
nr:PREDICTED: uncharacterized protein LOC105674771 [Linepithema humile]